jgi:hypothetical protein
MRQLARTRRRAGRLVGDPSSRDDSFVDGGQSVHVKMEKGEEHPVEIGEEQGKKERVAVEFKDTKLELEYWASLRPVHNETQMTFRRKNRLIRLLVIRPSAGPTTQPHNDTTILGLRTPQIQEFAEPGG